MKFLRDQRTIGAVIAGVILSLLTFPYYDLSIEGGIDPPLKWVFSHFAANGFENADYLNFPHGPLAFFMYPLTNTVGITIAFTFILKFLFIFLALRLYKELCVMRWVHIALTAYVVFAIGSINHLIIANVILTYLVFYRTRNRWYKVIGLLLTALAIYIKSYVGILTGLISVSLLIYMAWRYRKYLVALFDLSILFGLYYAIWIFLFGKLSGFFTYLYGIRLLAEDNSSAAAYYPSNNWWLLTVFLVITFLLPFVQRTQRAVFFGAIMVLSLFGAWKHGMAREDIFHVNGLFVYVAILYLIFMLFNKKKKMINVALITVALYCLSMNSERAYNYSEPQFNWWGISNISSVVEEQNDLVLSHHSLTEREKEIIGNSTVDVYPWDYSIIAHNNLNWKPRPVLHSYAAYSPWLDQRDADHFNSANAPEYIIWEKDKITSDLYQGQLQSIDQRYLLNNEPLTLLSIIQNYKAVSSSDRFLTLKKRKKKIAATTNFTKMHSGECDKWINVPENSSDLIRLHIEFEKPIKTKLKSFFYKDEQYWILLRTKAGRVIKHRIVPKNATNGLWINPFIERFDELSDPISSVQVVRSGGETASKFKFNWSSTSFSEDGIFSSLFGSSPQPKQYAFRSVQNYDDSSSLWSKPQQLTKGGTTNCEELKSEFSSTLEYNIDPEFHGNYKVYAQVELKAEDYEKLQLIVSYEGANDKWASFNCAHQAIQDQNWNMINGAVPLYIDGKDSKIRVYIFNPLNQKVLLDSFEVFLLKTDQN